MPRASSAAVAKKSRSSSKSSASSIHVTEGKPIAGDLVAGDWACHHGGSMDDPDFNNVHVEIRRGAEG